VNAASTRRDRPAPLALASRACVAALLLLGGLEARANADCTVTAVGINFGIYDPYLASPDDSVGEIRVNCTHLSGPAIEVRYTVTLSTGGSGSYALRRLRSGSAALGYNLSSDVARSGVWGNGSAGTLIVSGTLRVGPGEGNGVRSAVHPIYGRIPALQDAAEGDYTDSIVATLTY
jgi:spore coat protein U-like protein